MKILPLLLLIGTALAFFIILTACAPYPYANPYDRNFSTGKNETFIRADISVDGDASEWEDLFLALTPDAEGNSESDDPNTDIKGIYTAKDDTNAYFMLESWSGETAENVKYFFSVHFSHDQEDTPGEYRAKVYYDIDNSQWVGEVWHERWNSDDPEEGDTLLISGPELVGVGEVVEMQVPLEIYEDVAEQTYLHAGAYVEVYNAEDEYYEETGNYMGFSINF